MIVGLKIINVMCLEIFTISSCTTNLIQVSKYERKGGDLYEIWH